MGDANEPKSPVKKKIQKKRGKLVKKQSDEVFQVEDDDQIGKLEDNNDMALEVFNVTRIDYAGYNLISEADRNIIHEFLKDPVANIGATFHSPGDNFCIGRHIEELLYNKMVIDVILDMYMDVLYTTHRMNELNSPYIFASTAQMQLFQKTVNEASVEDYEPLNNLFTCTKTMFVHLKKAFCVIHTANHWHLLVSDFEAKKFISYNSLTGNKKHWLDVKKWVDWLAEYFMLYTDERLENWPVVMAKGIPKQPSDSIDCGVFVMKYMEFICQGSEPKFNIEDIPRFRAEIASILLKCGEKN